MIQRARAFGVTAFLFINSPGLNIARVVGTPLVGLDLYRDKIRMRFQNRPDASQLLGCI